MSRIEDNQPHKMLKTKQIIKRALKHPELFTEAELQYFNFMKQLQKKKKKKEKRQQSNYLQ
jgi:hypothetical protein